MLLLTRCSGRKRIIRVSTLMYQAEEGCKTGSVSIPYNYVEGVWVRKDMKTMVIHFRCSVHYGPSDSTVGAPTTSRLVRTAGPLSCSSPSEWASPPI